MTGILGYVAPTTQPDVLGVHSLDQFNLVVPDLTLAQRFYGAFGLELREEAETFAVHTAGQAHRWGTIGEGQRKKHGYLSFGVFEHDFERFVERLVSRNITRLDPPYGFDSNGLWFRDHDGNLIEIKVAAKSSPAHKTKLTTRSASPGKRGAAIRSAMQQTRPRRLAHILMFTTSVNKAIEFYTSVLGMRVSDRSGDNIVFLHGIHGSDHHMIAFARSNAPGHHHFSWDVGSIDEIGAGAMYMLSKGYSKGWGLGRHVLGSNYFHYVQDPWGSFASIPPT